MDDFSFGTLRQDTNDLGGANFDKASNIAIFYTRSVVHPFESEQAGRPIYKQKDYVRIITPGERDEVDREVEPLDKKRWASQWRDYQDGKTQEPDGTPLAHLFPGQPEIVDTLRSLKFATVEQLGAASDSALERIGMGGLDWRSKAKRFLEGTADASRFAKIERTMAEQAEELKALRLKNEALQADLDARGDDEAEVPSRVAKAARR